MLSLLHIEQIAVIESADIQFSPGFNVLTGETGAGKSIVIDAIGAITGGRTSRDLIRTGAGRARVEAQFVRVARLPWLEENGVPLDEDGGLVIQREILSDGRNICRVNGRLVNVGQLRELGSQLVNIHGQHDGQQLLDERSHLGYLDSFGELEGLREAYREAFDALTAVRREMAALRMDDAEKARRLDSLQFQIGELERARLQPGEEEELTARRTLLRNAERLIDAVERAHLALSGDDEQEGAAGLIATAEGALSGAAGMSESLAEAANLLAELRAAADDAAERVRDLRAAFDFEPGELDQVESRLDVLYRLKKKYGGTVEEMLSYLERCRAELDEIAFSSDTLSRLEKEQAKRLALAREKAAALTEARKRAGAELEARIQSELTQLDMPRVRFRTEIRPKGGELGLDETGGDEVQFLMSANVGEDLKPIQRIASGGELSRIMLALKNVLAENESIDTLIFDEVDTGVSGRAAQKVAMKMADVARNKQVLCVTHLPQIAAMASVHFVVEKGERDGRTYTRVERLDRPGRVEALARLTGGSRITPAIRTGAEELLRTAEEYRGN